MDYADSLGIRNTEDIFCMCKIPHQVRFSEPLNPHRGFGFFLTLPFLSFSLPELLTPHPLFLSLSLWF